MSAFTSAMSLANKRPPSPLCVLCTILIKFVSTTADPNLQVSTINTFAALVNLSSPDSFQSTVSDKIQGS